MIFFIGNYARTPRTAAPISLLLRAATKAKYLLKAASQQTARERINGAGGEVYV